MQQNISLQPIVDSIADGLFTVDRDWNITLFNKAASRITGIAVKDALGRKCWEVFRSSVCDSACVLRSCLETGTQQTNRSIFFMKPDGTRVPISISASPLRDRKGSIIGGVETFRDLTAMRVMQRKLDNVCSVEDIRTRSPLLMRFLQILPNIAASGAAVLLLGESGTGKELFARAIHNQSPRAGKPFVAVNCGALPGALLESELFGYKAGAFTDARKDKPGRFETARGGTIFLDEIGDMPLPLQVKLLRVLQDKVFEPLGAVKSVQADVRVIAATNRDLEAMAAQGLFRHDLFYRLNVVQIKLPPLRERPEDIALLTEHFVTRQRAVTGKDIEGVSEDVMQLLMRLPYPGNVRELENIIEYAFILCPHGFIQPEHLPDAILPARTASGTDPLCGTMEEIRHRAAVAALARNKGRRMAACRELGITKDTLRRILASERASN